MKASHGIVSFAAALGALWLTGCATTQTRISDNPAAFAQLPPDQQALVKQGLVGVGFSREAVRLAVGRPDGVIVHASAAGRVEIWHYLSYDYHDYGRYSPLSFRDYYGHRDIWGGGYYSYYGYPLPGNPDRLTVEFLNGAVTAVWRSAS